MLVNIKKCSACGKDHVDLGTTRAPTKAEFAEGFVWVAECPETGVEVFGAPRDVSQKKMDAKFYGDVFKAKDDSRVPDDEYIVFLVKDNAFAAILPLYLHECIQQGADDEQIRSVQRMIGRVGNWRAQNLHRLKTPDAKGERLLA